MMCYYLNVQFQGQWINDFGVTEHINICKLVG